jgi:hypothetical protein
MIPENVDCFSTEGEKHFYQFLENVAKPDNEYLVWYTPDIEGHEPDFILFHNKVGLIVFEVKDWILDQIVEADPHRFVLTIAGKAEPRKNPFLQARNYFLNIMDVIKDDGRLISRDQAHMGNPKIPIDYGVVFPNINKYEYTEKGFDRVINAEKIFFWDDLHPDSQYCTDPTGNCFSIACENMFAPKFRFVITHTEILHLKQLIFPTVRVILPQRSSDFPYTHRITRLKSLDHQQEAIARKFDGGHRIIVGPAGSGKTLILAHKAVFLMKYNPNIKSILFVCYNITLVNYIKRLLSDRKVPMGKGGVTVLHFYELCTEIIGEDVAYEKETSEYYEVIQQEALDRVDNYGVRYDAILVDEGQDFSDSMYKIVTSLLNKTTNNLTIAIDDNQDIYRRSSTWKQVGVQARGRIHKISHIYRNTKQISEFASKFIKDEDPVPNTKEDKQIELFPGFFDFTGSPPELRSFENFDAITEYTAATISGIIEREQCPCSEIAIIYCKKSIEDQSARRLPELFERVLNSKGILCGWASENYQSKKTYDITTNKVTISTIHSTKGFDYACVFLVGLDLLEEDGWTREQIRNMTYVAITRARYQLFIPFIQETPLIKRLMECL